MRKVLFLCHIEEMFEKFFPCGDIFEYSMMIEEHLEETDYDQIIILDSDLSEPLAVCKWYATDHWWWSWGYDPSNYDEDDPELDLFIESSGHEWTMIPDELDHVTIDRLKQSQVFVCGGCDSECLEDWRCVLDHVGVEFTDVPELIY